MCKTWGIKYTCAHIFTFRLSTCGGTFTTRSKPTRDPKPACSTAPTLILNSRGRCGPCEREKIEEAMEWEIAALRARAEFALDGGGDFVDDEIVEEALQERAKSQFRLSRMYPGDQRFKKVRCLGEGRRVRGLQKSPLRREVLRDEIIEKKVSNNWENATDPGAVDEDKAYYDEWAQGWDVDDGLSLEAANEIAKWMAVDGAEERTLIPFPDQDLVNSEVESTTSSVECTFSDHAIEEPEPGHLPSTIPTGLDNGDNVEENMSPSIQYKLQDDDVSRINDSKSFSEKYTTVSSSTESGERYDVDLLQRIRCIRAWMFLSS